MLLEVIIRYCRAKLKGGVVFHHHQIDNNHDNFK